VKPGIAGFARALFMGDDRQPLLPVHLGDGAFAHVGLADRSAPVRSAPRNIAPRKSARCSTAPARLAWRRSAAKILARVRLAPDRLAAFQDRTGQVRIRQIAARQVEPFEDLVGEVRARAAHPARHQKSCFDRPRPPRLARRADTVSACRSSEIPGGRRAPLHSSKLHTLDPSLLTLSCRTASSSSGVQSHAGQPRAPHPVQRLQSGSRPARWRSPHRTAPGRASCSTSGRPGGDQTEETGVQSLGLSLSHTFDHRDPGGFQPVDATPITCLNGSRQATITSAGQRRPARRRKAASCRNGRRAPASHRSRAARGVPGLRQRLGFGVGAPARRGDRRADDASVLDHDAAHGRVRRRGAQTRIGQRQRGVHEAQYRPAVRARPAIRSRGRGQRLGAIRVQIGRRQRPQAVQLDHQRIAGGDLHFDDVVGWRR
jgi:hypothetical protein